MSNSAEVSVADDRTENQFWESPPAYSLPPPAWSDPPPPRKPSGARSFGAKALFAILFSGVLALLAFEAAHVLFGVSWSDVPALLG